MHLAESYSLACFRAVKLHHQPLGARPLPAFDSDIVLVATAAVIAIAIMVLVGVIKLALLLGTWEQFRPTRLNGATGFLTRRWAVCPPPKRPR